MSQTVFVPPGPVARRFLEAPADAAPFQVLMGPVGSAKTTTGLMRSVLTSYKLKPGRDGVRRARVPIVRRTYQDLERTTMVSWRRWFPATMGEWKGGRGEPAVHTLPFAHPDGGRIDLMVEFIALGDKRMEEVLRGYEGSWAFVDEIDNLDREAVSFLFQRMGRYHPECGAHLRCVLGAMNAPEADNWACEDFLDEPKPGRMLFLQPGGLTPDAENLANLAPGYYEGLAEAMAEHDKRRFVDCIPGLSRGADPVYPEFSPDAHVARAPILPMPGELLVGMDAGGTPAAGVWQRRAGGQWAKLAEITTHAKDEGSITGPHRFGQQLAVVLEELMRAMPPGHPRPHVRGVADPSAAYGADRVGGESSWLEIVGSAAGIPVVPAQTNDPTPRREAIRKLLTQRIDGTTPAIVISPTCKATARALTRDYRFGRIAGTNARRTDQPLKNWASHLVEADQYALMEGQGLSSVLLRQQAARNPGAAGQRRSFNPFRAA